MALPTRTTLNGIWRLLPVEMFAQGYYPLADDLWIAQELPAHWQQHPLLEQYDGKIVYRRQFGLDDGRLTIDDSSETGAGVPDHPNGTSETSPNGPSSTVHRPQRRHWLRLNGCFYWSQPFLNGVDLGRHEGYFAAQEHDVTAWVQPENTLVVEVECPDEHNKSGKRLITGVFSHWDGLDPETNPGGIWLPVELITTGPVRIKGTQVHTQTINDANAELRYRATFDVVGAADVTLRWTITPQNFAGAVQTIEERRSLADGVQTIGGMLNISDPQLWWTHDMGHPNLYRITLEVLCGGERSDAHVFSFGIRTIQWKRWVVYLNGVRVFIKGNNYPPGDTRIATMTRERFDHDLILAQECHMNMLRVHAHVEHPEFYEAADTAGVLIWQDFPLQWLYRREVLSEARRQVIEMTRMLYNHPSIAIWCMHNEPIYTADTTQDERLRTRIRTYGSVFVYSWNRDVLDTQLKELVTAEDTTRSVVRASGEYHVPYLREGTDSHFYFGWYIVYGQLHRWLSVVQAFPDNIRFVTEFGAQSFPNLESSLKFIDADVRKLDLQQLVDRHHFQPNILEHWVDWRAAGTLEDLVRVSQDYQIAVNRFYIDRLRLHKYRPTGGIVPFMFHDSNPAVQWSIVDYWRVPKRSYAAMRLAFSPQYIFTTLDVERHPVGAPLELPVYVVNDAHAAIHITATARLLAPDGAELATIEREVTLPADCMAFELERLRLTPQVTGEYQLVLELQPVGAEPIAQSYPIVVTR
jgi:beta-mannosidase